MVLLRNGVAASGQLAVADIAAFTLPDTDFTTQRGGTANGSNVFDRFGGLAIGSNGETTVGSAVRGALSTNTGLGAEHTADGLGRKYGVTTTAADEIRDGCYTWVDRAAGAGDRFVYKSNWSCIWQNTGATDKIVAEVAPVNSPTANTGVAAGRHVFDTDWTLEPTDAVRLIYTIEHDGSFTAGGGGAPGGVLTNEGLLELARLMMDEDTDRIGYNSVPPYTLVAGDWLDEDHTGAAIGVPTKFDQLAIGSAVTATNPSQTALGAELTGATDTGAARLSGADVVGELMTPPGSNEDFDTAAIFNTFVGDTVQWRPNVVAETYFVVEGAGFDYGEAGVFNGDATNDVMLIRSTRGVVNTYDSVGDRVIPIIRMVSQL